LLFPPSFIALRLLHRVTRAQSGTQSMTPEILVKNVALWGTDGLCDIGIANGRFVSIGQSAASSNAGLTLDAEGRMAVAGFVEPHIHLDKALISERAPVNISGTLTEAIEILWNIKRNYTVVEIAETPMESWTSAGS
jgi:cytosine deaminase